MAEHERDTGLVRAMGPWGLATSTINLVVGAGIFTVPAALAGGMGAWAPLAFLGCGIVMGCIALCFAEGGSRLPTSGGAYGYIDTAFGPLAGYVSGTLLWFSNALACGGVVAALADLVASLARPAYAGTLHTAAVLAVIGSVALLNIGGVSRAARVIGVATVLKLIPLVVFLAAGAFAVHTANLQPVSGPGAGGVGRAFILALFAFTGMETSLSASGEVRDPSRTIPRALAIAMAVVTLLYVAVQTIAQGILGADLPGSSVPLADAMARLHPVLRLMMLTGAGVSMLGWVSSDLLGSPRILFAFARDGKLPSGLGRLHPRARTPHVAIAVYATLAAALALSGSFAELAVLSTLAVSVVYLGGCLAAWKLSRRHVALAGAPLEFRGLPVAATVGVAGMVGMIALAARTEIVGLIVLMAVCVAVYLLQSALAPRVPSPRAVRR